MFYWVIYDITGNRLRSKVAAKCKDYGLRRVQKSAFVGELSRNKVEMLDIEIKDIIKETKHCVFIFPSCSSCFNDKIIEGFFDEDSVRVKDYHVIGGADGKAISYGN